eukprot:6188234-Pleurochrysis_carterae.AAC.1
MRGGEPEGASGAQHAHQGSHTRAGRTRGTPYSPSCDAVLHAHAHAPVEANSARCARALRALRGRAPAGARATHVATAGQQRPPAKARRASGREGEAPSMLTEPRRTTSRRRPQRSGVAQHPHVSDR